MSSDAPVPRRRLHPVSLVFTLGSHARSLVVPAVLVLFLSRGETWQRWLLIPFGVVLLTEIVKYLSLSYALGPDAMVIRQGLLSRRERHIPYERIQNIELVQNALHRLVSVGEVRIDTGAGEEAEAHLRVVSLAAVDEIRARVAARRQDAAADVAPATVLSLGLGELSLHGIFTARGTVILAALAGLFWELDVDAFRLVRGLPWAERLWSDVIGFSGRTIALVVALVAFAAFVLRVLSAAWSVVRLYGFTLTRREDELHCRYGLLTQVATTIPRERIQLVTIEDGPWHRWFSRTSLRVDTAGRFAKEQEVAAGSQILAPIVRRERIGDLVREVQPDVVLDQAHWRGIDPRTFRRLLIPRLAFVIVAAAVTTTLGAPRWTLVGATVLAVALIWDAWVSARLTAYTVSDRAIFFRSGAWTRRLSVARFPRIQAVTLSRSPVDRWWQTATVQVDTAGAPTFGHRIAIPFLPDAEARELYDRLRASIEPLIDPEWAANHARSRQIVPRLDANTGAEGLAG